MSVSRYRLPTLPAPFSLIRSTFALLLLTAASLGLTLTSRPVQAADTLATIKARGVLRCGVSEGIPGFSFQDGKGRWRGMDADFCRAVAAATLGSPEKVQFVPLKSSTRFIALNTRKIDLLARNTSWTLIREATLGLQFPAVLFYDGQGFMVPAKSRLKTPADLANKTVCVEKGTTHPAHLAAYFGVRGLRVDTLVIDSATEAATAYFAGRCAAYSSDVSQLAGLRLKVPGGAKSHVILAERISKEILGPVVLDVDSHWATLVRWVLFALIRAEEEGITQASVRDGTWARRDPAGRLLPDRRDVVAAALGFSGDWAARAVRAVGNYGEMYERNLGQASGLAIERGYNRLWNQGGLMYAPPLE